MEFEWLFGVMLSDKHCPQTEATQVKNCTLINGVAASTIWIENRGGSFKRAGGRQQGVASDCMWNSQTWGSLIQVMKTSLSSGQGTNLIEVTNFLFISLFHFILWFIIAINNTGDMCVKAKETKRKTLTPLEALNYGWQNASGTKRRQNTIESLMSGSTISYHVVCLCPCGTAPKYLYK